MKGKKKKEKKKKKKKAATAIAKFVWEIDAPAPMPAMLKPKPAKNKKMAVKLIPAERSTARTSVSMSVWLCTCSQDLDFKLTGPIEEFQKLFGILGEPVNSLLGVLERFQKLLSIGHGPVHELLGQIALLGQSSEPGNDVFVVGRVKIQVLEVKVRRRHLGLLLIGD